MAALDEITCAQHGKAYATFVCEHLLEKRPQTWYCEPATEAEPLPGAWCDICHEAYLAEGEWNEKSEQAANLGEIVQAICNHCYEDVRKRHRVVTVQPTKRSV